MATPNRMAILTKMHKVLKKHYKPALIPDRPVLEHLLYACCLENSQYEAADKAFEAVSTGFFDWNEVRVSTVKELAEVMNMLPDPPQAAARLKKSLQAVFESTYSFDLEGLKKQNLGQAQQRLKKFEGVTHFAVAYVTQATLGGHAIPIGSGLMETFKIFGLVTRADVAAGVVPGLERAIPKTKGIEFASLAHQLGAEVFANPYSPAVHKLLLEIAPEAKENLPKRPPKGGKPKESAEEPSKAGKAKSGGGAGESAKSSASKKTAAPAAGKKTPPAKERPSGKKDAEKKKSAAAAGLSKRKPR